MILILAFGNPTRQDDGAGWEVVRRLEEKKLPGVQTQLVQQLGLEILEEWGAYNRVIFVDATPIPGPVQIKKVEITESTPPASTHHLKPETLLHLSQKLYGQSPELYLCGIPGASFDFGGEISPSAQKNIEIAVRLIEEWLKS